MSGLIGWLDEDGYLREDDTEICDSLDIAPARLAAALGLLRGLNPAGIFARNLRDCLSLQWQRLPDHDPAQIVLLDHLDLLARGKLDRLGEICDFSKEELGRALRDLQSLNPRPAAEFARTSVSTQAPEILVRRDGDGWQVSLNDDIAAHSRAGTRLGGNGKTSDERLGPAVSGLQCPVGALAGARHPAARNHHVACGTGRG